MVSLSPQKCGLLKEKSNKKEKGNNNSSFSIIYSNTNLKDAEKIQARYEDGVLHLVIPKKEEAKQKPPRVIEIA